MKTHTVTFVHGNRPQAIPVAMVLTVHHDGLLKTLTREKIYLLRPPLGTNNAKLQ